MHILVKIKKVFSFLKSALDRHPLLFLAILSIIENFAIESMSRHSLFSGIEHITDSPVVFFYNSFIIMLTLSFSLLFKRRVLAVVLLSAPWLICGLINSVVLTYRVTPLGAIDFQVVKLSLIFMYLTKAQRILLYVAIGVFVVSIVAIWILGPKISGKVHYGKNIAAIAGIIVTFLVTTGLAHQASAISTDFGNLAGAYKDYGFVYCFSSSMLDTGINKPSEYGKEKTDEILSIFPETVVPDEKQKKPDVVLIQLESFLDPKTIKDMTFSQDPAPVHTYLKENFSFGNLSVPSLGGGTANTEFEVLTGINMDNFGPGEYPYKTIMLEETCESLAYNLKENGYSAHAIHNHTGNFYDRDKVYPHMGFDSFQSKEYMHGYETTYYGWCKDKVLTEEIMTALTYTDEENGITKDKPRFVWTVSVQGHGAYPSEPIEGIENLIKIQSDNFTPEEICALEYYINQLYEMDMFLGDLIKELNKRKRPTLLIAYGDHLPAIGLESHDLLTGNDYMTQYVTWNNFGLEKSDRDLHTYELSGEIMRSLGYNNGNLTKLHQLKSSENTPLTEETYQNYITYLAYDMLYGENTQFGNVKPYIKTPMRMGTLPVTVDGLRYDGTILCVEGTGFTEKSKIFINGKKHSTIMVSENELTVKRASLNDGDEIKVGQASSKREILGYSNPVRYSEAQHKVAPMVIELQDGSILQTQLENKNALTN